MGELVKYIAINLVDKPEEVKVVENRATMPRSSN